jgi:hypothetical protein
VQKGPMLGDIFGTGSKADTKVNKAGQYTGQPIPGLVMRI